LNMKDKFAMGFAKETGHPLEAALESFLMDNTEWILSQHAIVSFYIIKKPWAEAVLLVTPQANEHWKSDEVQRSKLLQELNHRLITAGYKTNLPPCTCHDGHLIKDRPCMTIEILSRVWEN